MKLNNIQKQLILHYVQQHTNELFRLSESGYISAEKRQLVDLQYAKLITENLENANCEG